MAAEVECYGRENAMNCFRLHNTPDFAVFAGQGDKWRLKFSVTDKNQDESEMIFRDNLDAVDATNDATYQVRFYRKLKDGDEPDVTTPYSSSFNFKVKEKMPFQMAEKQMAPAAQFGHLSYGDQQWIKFLQDERIRLMEENRQLKEEVETLENELDELELGDGEPELGALGTIGAAGQKYPWIQDQMSTLIGVFDRLTRAIPGMNSAPAAAAPAPMGEAPENTEAKFKAALQKLLDYYNKKYPGAGEARLAEDLWKLAQLTDKPMIFDMALQQLKSL